MVLFTILPHGVRTQHGLSLIQAWHPTTKKYITLLSNGKEFRVNREALTFESRVFRRELEGSLRGRLVPQSKYTANEDRNEERDE